MWQLCIYLRVTAVLGLCFATMQVTARDSCGPSGSYTMACLNRLWLQAGCLTQGTKSPINSPYQVSFWRQHDLQRVMSDMSLYRRYADLGRGDYPDSCFGTGSRGVAKTECGPSGSYTMACLNRLWLQAGCLTQGTKSPINSAYQVRFWRQHHLQRVMSDMSLYRRYADLGRGYYPASCFGTGSRGVARTECGPSGSYTMACLNRLWLQAGCLTQGTKSPINSAYQVRFWRQHHLQRVMSDMSLYRRYADLGRGDYPASCFGTGSRGVARTAGSTR